MNRTSRSEGVALRPFTGVDKIEHKLKHDLTLEIQSNSGANSLSPDEWLFLTKGDISKLGLRLAIVDPDELLRVVDPLVMDLADVEVLVVAYDRPGSPLRETEVIARLPIGDLGESIVLNAPGSVPHSRILNNKQSGFKIEFALVQSRDVEGENSIRPRTRGALISKAVFEVKPVLSGESFQPEPLTESERERLGLGPDVLMYVDPQTTLLSAESFRESARFFVHESILANIQFMTGDVSLLAQSYLLDCFISGFVYSVSNAIASSEDFDSNSFIESSTFRLIANKNKSLSNEALINELTEAPHRIVANWQSDKVTSKAQLLMFKNLTGGSNDLSDSDS
ncbi:MAG: hypothetical protein RL716_487 [Actinomycetota bacterium]